MSNSDLVCVVGAGISGLAAAQELLDRGENVVVLESRSRAGGVIETTKVGDLLFEKGPNSFPSSADQIIDLAKKAGVSDRVITANEAA